MTQVAEKIKNDPFLLDTSFLDQYSGWQTTGFRLCQQIQKLTLDYEKNPSASTLDCWTQQTNEDLQGFWLEFLCQKLVLPIKIQKAVIDGQAEIVAPFYGNASLVETVSPQERNGATLQAVEKITDFLLTACPGSLAVMISPSGWSGLTTTKGEKIVYPETQIYLYQVNFLGEIEALTIRGDTTLFQNQTLAYVLSGGETKIFTQGTTAQQIASLVSQPILVPGTEKPFGFAEVIKALEKIKNSDYVLKNRTFFELWESFDQRSQTFCLEQNARDLIGNFTDFMAGFDLLTDNGLAEIAQKLEQTLLALTALKKQASMPPGQKDLFILDLDFQKDQLIAYAQSLPGCTGSIFAPSLLVTSLGTRFYNLEITSFVHCGKCGKFGRFGPNEGFCSSAIKIS